jgi:ribonuclease Z
MSISVVFLGTSGSVPTSKRALPAVAIRRKDELILFDCGEGAQRQMIQAKIGFHKKMKVFITHMHGDHVLGLPGLLQTMALFEREKPLDVYGPVGIKAFIEAMKNTVQFVLTYPVSVHEIKDDGVICKEKEYDVHALWVEHVVPTLAYSFEEKPRAGKFFPEKAKKLGIKEGPLWAKLQQGENVKLPNGRVVKSEEVTGPLRMGRKIVYTGDTKHAETLAKFAENADLLIHDATFDDEMIEKAIEDGHSTPSQAAETAKKAKVKQLILTHISARYKDASLLLEQARKIFPKVKAAEDFIKIELPLKDH